MVTATKPTATIHLPPLHAGRDNSGGQIEIFQDTARFKVVICGRRWGKTTLGVLFCFRTAAAGGRTWWVAPTYPIANIGWRMVKNLVKQLPDVEIREQDKEAILPSGGVIQVKSADNPDSLRGEGLDGVVLDEVAQIREVAWTEALRPALSDKRGWALFIGTPKGKNWLWSLYQRAGIDDNWARWRRPTLDNPYIDPDEIAQAKLQLLPNVFAQEYEADFGASQLLVYSDFDRVLHQWKNEIPQFDIFFGGLDFGGTTIGSHKSAGTFAGYTANTDTVILLEEFEASGPNVDDDQITWMGETLNKWQTKQRQLGHRPVDVVWRADKSQGRFISIMNKAGWPILPSKGGPDSVSAGIDLVHRRLKFQPDGRSRIYYAPYLNKFPEAMERYRYPELRDGDDKVQSKNPLKVNDDLVDAFRYMIEGVDLMVVGDPQDLYKNALGSIA